MREYLLKHKIALVVILLLLITNGLIVFKAFRQVGVDIRIANIKGNLKDGIYNYQISLKNSKPVTQDAVVQLIYQDGSNETFSYDLNTKSYLHKINTEKRLEYVGLQVPPEIDEVNLANNQHILNLWSPKVQVFDSYSVPDYTYIVDDAGQIWIVSSGRDGKGIALGVYLTLLGKDGTILLYKKQLSNPELYSTYPVLRYIDNQVHIFWASFEDNRGYLAHQSYVYQDGQLLTMQSEEIREESISFQKAVTRANATDDPQILVLREQGRQSGFTMFKITPDGVKQDFDFDLSSEHILDGNNHYGFEYDDDGNCLVFWSEFISRRASHSLTKISPEGETILSKNNFFETSAEVPKIGLKILRNDEHFILLFTEYFGAMTWSSRVCLAAFDTGGNFVQDRMIIDDQLSLDITGVVDEFGNLNLAWSRRTRANSGVNYELFYQQLDSEFRPITPEYRITEDPADKFGSVLQFVNNERYQIWREIKDDGYQLYVHSTLKDFGQRSPDNPGFFERIFKATVGFMVSQVTQLIAMVFYNVFPITGALIVIVWFFSTGRVPDRRIHWFAALLLLLLLEYLNFSYLQVFPQMALDYTLRILTYIFLIYVGGFYLLNRKEISYGVNFLYIFSWIVMNSFIVTLAHHLYGII